MTINLVFCTLTSHGPSHFFGASRDRSSPGPTVTSGAAWEAISGEARSWVASLLRWAPSERLSAEEVLNHPWLWLETMWGWVSINSDYL